MARKDPRLTSVLDALAPAGIQIAHRVIEAGDEDALMPTERPYFVRSVAKVRQRSGGARIAARELLARFGHEAFALPRSQTAGPQWPPGLVGSLAHDDEIAVAAVAPMDRIAALGIDIEPAAPLPESLAAMVATPAERARYPHALLQTRLLFSIKEAVFKALNPLDGVILDFHDIEVDLDAAGATTKTGQHVTIAFRAAPRVVAVAYRAPRAIRRA